MSDDQQEVWADAMVAAHRAQDATDRPRTVVLLMCVENQIRILMLDRGWQAPELPPVARTEQTVDPETLGAALVALRRVDALAVSDGSTHAASKQLEQSVRRSVGRVIEILELLIGRPRLALVPSGAGAS